MFPQSGPRLGLRLASDKENIRAALLKQLVVALFGRREYCHACPMPNELAPDLYESLKRHCAHGDELAEKRTFKDAIVEYRRGNREDLVDAATAQIKILEEYLPQPLGEDQVRALVQAAIAETGASSPKQMGLVMRVLMPQVRGRADGKVVSQMVRTMLARQGG